MKKTVDDIASGEAYWSVVLPEETVKVLNSSRQLRQAFNGMSRVGSMDDVRPMTDVLDMLHLDYSVAACIRA